MNSTTDSSIIRKRPLVEDKAATPHDMMFLRTSNTTNGKNGLTLSAAGPRNQKNFLFLSLFCSCRNQAELYLSHLGNRIQKMQLVTDLVSNEREWDA